MSEVADHQRILTAHDRAQRLREKHGEDALAQALLDLADGRARGLPSGELLLLEWTVLALEGRL